MSSSDFGTWKVGRVIYDLIYKDSVYKHLLLEVFMGIVCLGFIPSFFWASIAVSFGE